jgi:hypothetical protein
VTNQFQSYPAFPAKYTGRLSLPAGGRLGKPPVEHVLDYARAGRVMLPLEHGGNDPHKPILGGGWHYDEEPLIGSTDEDQIRYWWGQDPGANIGMVTGPRSGVLILDLDRPKRGNPGGEQSLHEWLQMIGQTLPDTYEVTTPSGGKHLWYFVPRDLEPLPMVTDFLPGVDVPKMVAVPPSCRYFPIDEHNEYIEQYRWTRSVDQWLAAPEWLLSKIREGRQWSPLRPAQSGSDWHSASQLPATEWFLENGFRPSSRNDDCHRLSCKLWSIHWPHGDLVRDLIFAIWQKTYQAPGDMFPWAEAMKCIKSAERYMVPKIMAQRAWIGELEERSWLGTR